MANDFKDALRDSMRIEVAINFNNELPEALLIEAIGKLFLQFGYLAEGDVIAAQLPTEFTENGSSIRAGENEYGKLKPCILINQGKLERAGHSKVMYARYGIKPVMSYYIFDDCQKSRFR